MLGSIVLAVACLEIPQAADSAYAVLIGESRWSCGGGEDLAAASAARPEGEDVIWVRVDRQAYALRERVDVDEMAALLAPLRALEARQTGLAEKLTEYDGELSRLAEERSRLDADRARYAPLSEKNKVVSTEWSAVDERLRVLAARRAELAPDQERMREELSRAFGDARRRLGLLVERAVRFGTAQEIHD